MISLVILPCVCSTLGFLTIGDRALGEFLLTSEQYNDLFTVSLIAAFGVINLFAQLFRYVFGIFKVQ